MPLRGLYFGGKMKISIGENNKDFIAKDVNGNSALDYVITKHDYSFGIFKDNKRKNENFIEAHAFGLDFDGGMKISEAKYEFRDYKHIIAPTRNHRKEKAGVVDDRFRVILFFDKIVTNSTVYTNTIKSFIEKYPQADAACKDPARMFYKSTGIHSHKTKGKLITPVIEHVKIVEETKPNTTLKYISDAQLYSKLGYKTKDFLENGAEDGEWHNKLITALFEIRRYGASKDQAERLVKGITGNIDDTDKFHIDDVYNNREVEVIAEKKKSILNVVSLEDFYKEEYKFEWLADNFLHKGGISVLAGDSKIGKSTLTRQLIRCTTEGDYFLGRKVTKGKVLYLALDESRAWVQHELRVAGVKPGNVDIHTDKLTEFGAMEIANEIKELATENNTNLVIVDTLVKVLGDVDINHYVEVDKALNYYSEVARTNNFHIMFVHHTNKSEFMGQNSFMGSKAIVGSTDNNILFYSKNGDRFITTDQRGGKGFNHTKLEYNHINESYRIARKNPVETEEEEF